ncbi:hypothetical protein DFAR_2740020 [Desulfarculales bacterium]
MVIAMRDGCQKGEVPQVIAALRGYGLQVRMAFPGFRVVMGVMDEISCPLTE